jgi:hypothetical protein
LKAQVDSHLTKYIHKFYNLPYISPQVYLCSIITTCNFNANIFAQ